MNRLNLFLFLTFLICTKLIASSCEISGFVTDQQTGSGCPDVQVTILFTDITAKTDFDGEYSISNINSGTYSIEFSGNGYQTVTLNNIYIEENEQLNLDITLKSENSDQNNLNRTGFSTYNQNDLNWLPVMDYYELINLTPGFVLGHSRGGTQDENTFLIDNINYQQWGANSFGLDLPLFAINRLSVKTGNINYENLGNTPTEINARLNEGGKKYHGNLRYSNSNYTWMNNDYENDLMDKQVNFSLSGPLIPEIVLPVLRDKISFFIAGNFSDDDGRVEHLYDKTNAITGNIKFKLNSANEFKFTFLTNRNKIGSWNPQWKQHITETTDLNGNGNPDTYYMAEALPEYEFDTDLYMISWKLHLGNNASLKTYFSHYKSKLKGDVDESLYGGINFTDNNQNYILDHTENQPENEQLRWWDVSLNNYQDSDGYYIPGVGMTFHRNRWLIEENKVNTAGMNFEMKFRKNHLLKAGISTKDRVYDFYSIDLTGGGYANVTNIHDSFPMKKMFYSYIEDTFSYYIFTINAGLYSDYYKTKYSKIIGFSGSSFDIKAKNETFFKLNPRVNVIINPHKKLDFYLGYGEYTRTPGNKKTTNKIEFGVNYKINNNHNINFIGFKKSSKDYKFTLAKTNVTDTVLSNIYDNHNIYGFCISHKWIFNDHFNSQSNYCYQKAKGEYPKFRHDFIWYTTFYEGKSEMLLNWDQRHSFNAILNFKHDEMKLFSSLIFNAGSGFPYSPPSKTRIPLINTERYPANFKVNWHLRKTFTYHGVNASLYFNIFNLLNRENINPYYADVDFYHSDINNDGKKDKNAEGKYGEIRAYEEGRRVLIGLQFDF